MSRAVQLETLQAGVDELGLDIETDRLQAMLAYLGLIEKWNRVCNLTAVRGRGKMIPRHLLDSLTLLPYLSGERMLDIGSGAGLPGMPLALAQPWRQWWLLDSSAKRIRFLRQVVADLGLDNVSLVQQRVGEYRSDEKFATLVSRACSSLATLVADSGHLLAGDGSIIAMKGRWPGDETTTMPEGFHIYRVVDSHVPRLDEQRHLVFCRRDD